MQPAGTACHKDVLPIEVTGLAVGDRRIATVRAAHCGAHAKTALGKVQPVAHRSSNAIVGHPANERCINSSLKNQVLEQLSNRIPCKSSHNGGSHAEASSKSTSHVVFSTAFPGSEVARRMDALLARIEPQ